MVSELWSFGIFVFVYTIDHLNYDTLKILIYLNYMKKQTRSMSEREEVDVVGVNSCCYCLYWK